MTVTQPSQDPNKDAATSAWEQQVTEATNRIQHEIDNINESVVTSSPKVAIYSKTQDGAVQSFTPPADGDGFVAYYTYTDTLPTLPVTGQTFSAFSDEEIDYEIEQYREVAGRPTNPGTVSYVVSGGSWTSSSNWTKTKPTMAGVNVWVCKAQIVGSAGQTVVAKWSNPKLLYGGQIGEGTLYYTTAQASAPSAPTATGYDFNTGTFTGLTSGWQYVPITSAMGGGITISDKHWQVSFHVEVSETSEDQIFTWGTPVGFVPMGSTLQSDNFSSGSAGWQIVRNTGNAEFNNITARGVLDASSITTGTLDCSGITVSNLNAGSITTGTLDASNVTVTNLNASNITTGNLTATNVNFGVIMQVVQGSYSGSATVATLTATNNSNFNTILVAIANCYVYSGASEEQSDGSKNPSTGSNTLTLTGTGVNLSVGASAPTSQRNESKSATIKSGTLTKGATYTATSSVTGNYTYGGSGNILIFEVKI
tara:strand:+ start:964 stop:2406 length:1443 start_codon:yes stop_codon:yes gene_type:complete